MSLSYYIAIRNGKYFKNYGNLWEQNYDNKEPLSLIDILGYYYKLTGTEGCKGGTLIYISQDLT